MKQRLFILMFSLVLIVNAQQKEVLPDFRQHNQLPYASYLWNPTASLNEQARYSLTFWSRWQWQMPDETPSTLNLAGGLNWGQNAIRGSYFQHNTGFFEQKGGMINYAHAFELQPDLNLKAGLNLFGYMQQVSDQNSVPAPVVLDTVFILQVAPGLSVAYKEFEWGISAENIYAYNFDDSSSTTDIVWMTQVSYGIDLPFAAETASIRPQLYYKNIPGYDAQFGAIALYDSRAFWGQLGYNNYYGIGGGLGGRIGQNFALGLLGEYDSVDSTNEDPWSFEVVARISLPRKSRTDSEAIPEEPEPLQEAEVSPEEPEVQQVIEEQQEEPPVEIPVEQEEELEGDDLQPEIIEKEQEEEAPSVDKNPEVKDQIRSEGTIETGYYLVANVFATKKYFEAFMQKLKNEGLNPGSIYNAEKGYNYVYLRRTDSLEQAKLMRDSGLGGQYKEPLWILHVTE